VNYAAKNLDNRLGPHAKECLVRARAQQHLTARRRADCGIWPQVLSVTSNYRNLGSLRARGQSSILFKKRHPFPGPRIGFLLARILASLGVLI